MAGRTGKLLIPELADFRREWLDAAEVSFALDGPRITGLSFFFHEETSLAEFAAITSLDGEAMADERALRGTFPILPRYWLKIHFDGMDRCGLSQYFHITPGMHYPITTIRCFLRRSGMTDVGTIEEILKPALEAAGTEWGLAIKRYHGRTVPRIFFRLARPLLKETLLHFVRFGYLSEPAERLYLEWEERLGGGEYVFASLDPTLRKLSSIDFCRLPSGGRPGDPAEGFPETFDYLKVRIPGPALKPEFTAYMPLKKLKGGMQPWNYQA